MLFRMFEIPITDVVDIEKMQDIIMERFNSYSNGIYDISSDVEVVGHFMICLVACKSEILKEIIVKGEKTLLFQKMNQLQPQEIMSEILCLLKLLELVVQIHGDLSTNVKQKKIQNIVQNALLVTYENGKHIFDVNHKRECQKVCEVFSYTFFPKAVAKREVNLNKGKVMIHCGNWQILLERIVEYFVELEIDYYQNLESLNCMIYEMEDDRLREIITNCINLITGQGNSIKKRLLAEEIDQHSKYFPPCMANLHQILRKEHRLSYESRYQYTLFLKDIGLSVEENILFWRNEYLIPHCSSHCCHNWDEKSSRYEYQIYHLYGFVGSSASKTSHSCGKFIDKLSLKMNGGCPFVHYSEDALLKALQNFSSSDRREIMCLSNSHKPQEACARYLEFLQNKIANMKCEGSTITKIISPLHYYNLAHRFASSE